MECCTSVIWQLKYTVLTLNGLRCVKIILVETENSWRFFWLGIEQKKKTCNWL